MPHYTTPYLIITSCTCLDRDVAVQLRGPLTQAGREHLRSDLFMWTDCYPALLAAMGHQTT